MSYRKKLAKEWLYLISNLIVGFFVLPLVITFLFAPKPLDSWLEFYAALFGVGFHSRVEFGLWLIGLCPYIICQTVRATVWSIRNLKLSKK